jgi:hypothetical protein
MASIQNKRGISFAGAYLRYGFHEDAFTSGMRVAVHHLGVKPPFAIQDPDRPSSRLLLSLLFEFLETTGLRQIYGFLFSLSLRFWRAWITLFINLDHL